MAARLHCAVCGVIEAQIRFLKAKLRVMQEELDRLSAELAAKVCHFAEHSIYRSRCYTCIASVNNMRLLPSVL